jgi:hypothetical protein
MVVTKSFNSINASKSSHSADIRRMVRTPTGTTVLFWVDPPKSRVQYALPDTSPMFLETKTRPEIGQTIMNPAAEVSSADDRAKPISVAMRDMVLSVEEARELRNHIDKPSAKPTRPPRQVPLGDPSFLRSR